MIIGFSTYADHQMGMGHVFRCLNLRRAFAAAWPKAEFRFELLPGREGFELIEKVWPGEVRAAGSGPWDILVVDRLEVSPDEMRGLKAKAKVLVSLDDTGPGRWKADLAFNGLYKSRAKGSGAESREGFEALLIDESFSRVKREFDPAMKRVLISQGGADTYGIVPPLVAKLAPWAKKHGIVLHALVGPAFRHGEELEIAVNPHRGVVKVERGLSDLAGFFSGLDAAVSGAGLTACELAAAGVPALLITGEDKELETAAALAAAGAALDFGKFSPASLDALAVSLEALRASPEDRRRLSENAKKAIDGKAISRMIALIQGALTK